VHSRPPFTLQRLCELLTDEPRLYTSTNKFTNAIEKVRAVSSLLLPLPLPLLLAVLSLHFLRPSRLWGIELVLVALSLSLSLGGPVVPT